MTFSVRPHRHLVYSASFALLLGLAFARAGGPEPVTVRKVTLKEGTYWQVDDVQGGFDRLLSAGATVYEQPTERGPGFVTASVVDPFGNVLGLMYNAHYLEMLGSRPLR